MAVEIAVSNVRSATAGIPAPRATTITGATPGSGQGVYGGTNTPTGAGVSGSGVSLGIYGTATAKNSAGVIGSVVTAGSTDVQGNATYPAFKPPSPYATFPPGTVATGVKGASIDGNGILGVTTYPYLNADEPAGVVGADLATSPTVPTVARPTLEDVGASALRAGSVFVRLDPAFTASMEQTAPYMVSSRRMAI